jgi:hypothetical protein
VVVSKIFEEEQKQEALRPDEAMLYS